MKLMKNLGGVAIVSSSSPPFHLPEVHTGCMPSIQYSSYAKRLVQFTHTHTNAESALTYALH